jgi:hypothetical protein
MPKKDQPLLQLNKDQLDKFLQTRKRHRDKNKEHTGTLGGETNSFCENHGLNKSGLNMFNQLNEMSPEKRADTLRTLDGLRDMTEVEWGKQLELALEEQEAA